MYDLYGFDEFEKKLIKAMNNFPQRKNTLLNRLGRIYQREVIKLTPVDTGRLRADLKVHRLDGDSVTVATNVEYAKFVNDGHMQDERYLPCRIGSDGRLIYDPNSPTGVMLKRKFVKGVKFFEKGLYKAKPKLEAEIHKFMDDLKDIL